MVTTKVIENNTGQAKKEQIEPKCLILGKVCMLFHSRYLQTGLASILNESISVEAVHSLLQKNTVNKKKKIEQKIKRKEMLAAGAYDGRFREKVVVDKKKKQSRNWARKKLDHLI